MNLAYGGESEPVKLSDAAMRLAHEIALSEDGLRSRGYATDRISRHHARLFGPAIVRLAASGDTTANFIYRTTTVTRDSVATLDRSPEALRIMTWGGDTHERNRQAAD